MTVQVHHGDCTEVMARLRDDGTRVHAVVTDPPYHLTSITKRFGSENAAPVKSNGKSGGYRRASAGFMGQKWDGGDVAFQPDTWRLVWELLPPGGYLVAFGGPRTYHRLACAVEDAGFEIRDQIAWLFGSGFPKSHDGGKAFDRVLLGFNELDDAKDWEMSRSHFAAQWDGWGTALKPAMEPIVLARKPLAESSVSRQLLATGTGAINVDGCRVEYVSNDDQAAAQRSCRDRPGRVRWGGDGEGTCFQDPAGSLARFQSNQHKGRWPANVVHDGSDEVLAAFAMYGERTSGRLEPHHAPERRKEGAIYGKYSGLTAPARPFGGDSGSAARFFYCAKADATDRLGSRHPTVKPVDLMRWLVRMVTPPGGCVMDPFAGTGVTGMACMAEGFDAVLIEREDKYVADIRRRLAHVEGADLPLFTESAP